jgi:hypothetical protein
MKSEPVAARTGLVAPTLLSVQFFNRMFLVRFTRATRMPASAINIRHIFHSGASGAAIFAVGVGLAATIWMSAFLCVVHFSCLLFLETLLHGNSFTAIRCAPLMLYGSS